MTGISDQSSVGSKETRTKTMSRKISIWLLATIFLTTVSLAEAQQAKKVSRVGILSPFISSADFLLDAFR
jgi:hypothetical protein